MQGSGCPDCLCLPQSSLRTSLTSLTVTSRPAQPHSWRLMHSAGMEKLCCFPFSCAMAGKSHSLLSFWIILLDLSTLAFLPWFVNSAAGIAYVSTTDKPLYCQSFLLQWFPPQRNKTFLLALSWGGWSNSELSVQPRPVATTALFSVLKGKQCVCLLMSDTHFPDY